VPEYRNWLRLAAILGPLVCFLLYEWLRLRQRKLILARAHGRKPPYTWPFHVTGGNLKDYSSEQFFKAARGLRRRQIGEFQRLDVNGTIAATIAAGGYPRFQYKPDSKAPEYFALIDCASFRDHQAQLFECLVQALAREELFVVRYFYDGDPRVCWADASEGTIFLTDLQKKYPGHRLLLFGNGERLIDPLSGRLVSWATLLLEWQDRALLTPEMPASWGVREKTLESFFVVVPATLDGLEELADRFELPIPADLSRWRQNGAELPPPDPDRPITVAALRQYLGEETFQWLCVCAVYPELYWDLTLYLGSLPAVGESLVREQHLLKLIQLPWFRTGSLPDALRLQLISELDRQRERAVREAIIALLEHNPAPAGTFAADTRQLDLVAQRTWLNRDDRKKLRQAIGDLRKLPQGEIARDYTLVQLLESTPFSPLALLLPRRLRRLFYERGIPAFGLKTGVRAVTTLIVMTTAFVGVGQMMPVLTGSSSSGGEVSASPTQKLPEPTPTEEIPRPSPEPNQYAAVQPEDKQPSLEEKPSLPSDIANAPAATAKGKEPPASAGTATQQVPPSSPTGKPDVPNSTRETKTPGRKATPSITAQQPVGTQPPKETVQAPTRSASPSPQGLSGTESLEKTTRPGLEPNQYAAVPPEQREPRKETATVPPAALPSVSLSEAEVQSWLEIWRRTWEGRDVEKLIQLGAVSPQNADKLRQVFSAYKSFSVALQDVQIRMEENRATVSFSRVDTINGRTMRPIRWTMTLTKEPSGSIQAIARPSAQAG
jgi:hypothetical protein